MKEESDIEKIFNEVKMLTRAEQLLLLKKLRRLIEKENQSEKRVTLADLRGVGSEIWMNVDIDKYVSDERKW